MKPPSDPPSSPGTILVVDDFAANVNLLQETLEPQGYEVLVAGNGESGVKVAKRVLPDLILLDINMPGMDGYEACRQLKEDAATRDIPIMFITANDSSQNIVDGFRAGGVDYISKPFKAEEVLVRVETHLKINRLNRALIKQNDELTRLNAELQAEMLRRQQAEQSLSLLADQRAERFHTGGTLGPDAPSYVERRADRQLLSALSQGEFCYVLTSRQMGKSSLVVRAAKRLRERGGQVVMLDLTAIGQNLSPDQWYGGLLTRMGWQLSMDSELEEFWLRHERLSPVQRFFAAIREVVLKRSESPLTMCVDELDVLRSLPFPTDEFLAAIREQYNARSQDPALKRLTVCLLGVAAPTDLVKDARITSFNIGHRVELEDFTPQEAAPLARGLGRDNNMAVELMNRIYHWTNGHPYLTQRLCKGVVEDETVRTAAAVDDLCFHLLLSPKGQEQDDNLLFVRERLLRSGLDSQQLLELYGRIRNGEAIASDDNNPLIGVLKISGIIRVTDGVMRVRNRVYEQVFDRKWIAHLQGRFPNDQ